MLKSFIGKLEGMTLRLAMAAEFARWACEGGPEPHSISAATLEALADFVAAFAIPMGERVYGHAAPPVVDRNRATLATHILRNKPTTINLRALRKKVKLPGLSKADEVHAAIEALVDAGWLRESGKRKGGTNGRHTSDYAVNPANRRGRILARSCRDYGPYKRDIRDISPDEGGSEPPIVPIVSIVPDIPVSVRYGLERLATMAAPRLRRPEVWPEVIADAQRLVSDGWAATALSLGWTELDLFGAVFDAHGSADCDGLAARLRGRKVLALCPTFATVADGPGARSLYRRVAAYARLLCNAR